MTGLNQHLDPLQRSGIRRFTNMAKEVDDCVMLTIGEPDFDTPEPVKAAACAALAAGQTHYAPNQGTLELRQAIAAFERGRGMDCDPAQVLVTVGATGALYTALTGILDAGDEVVIPTPAFSLHQGDRDQFPQQSHRHRAVGGFSGGREAGGHGTGYLRDLRRGLFSVDLRPLSQPEP